MSDGLRCQWTSTWTAHQEYIRNPETLSKLEGSKEAYDGSIEEHVGFAVCLGLTSRLGGSLADCGLVGSLFGPRTIHVMEEESPRCARKVMNGSR